MGICPSISEAIDANLSRTSGWISTKLCGYLQVPLFERYVRIRVAEMDVRRNDAVLKY